MGIKISIITAVLNRRTMIARAIDSVCKQGLEDIQHIVVDGGSSDGTLEVLKNYSHLQISSEPDINLYDAWNKGIKKAKGSFIIILNSDDELPENSLNTARQIAHESQNFDMISGSVELSKSIDDKVYETRLIDSAAMINLREHDMISGIPLTNARYLSRQLLEKVGAFDVRYNIISDRQFFLRALLQKPKNITTNKPLYRYHIHDNSLSLNDKKPSVYLSNQCLEAAIDGMREAKTKPEFNSYRKWHAWSAFYLSLLQTRNGRFSEALKIVLPSTKRDPLWAMRLPSALAKHMGERKQRCGKII